MVACPQCHSLKLAHHVCPTCGTYKGQEVVEVEKKKKKE
jgi:large subunit ribosomal protein L32